MAVKQLFTNNATTTLADAVAPGDASITVAGGDGAKFPNPTLATQFAMLTLIDGASNIEIVKLTSRSGDVLSITRAQEGTSALTLAPGDRVELRITAGGLGGFPQKSANETIAGAWTFQGLVTAEAGVSIAAGGLTVDADGFDVTGNSSVTGNLAVSGALTKGGANVAVLTGANQTWTIENILTGITRIRSSTTPAILFQNSTSLLSGALWAVATDGTNFGVVSNTAAGGDFSTYKLPLKISESGVQLPGTSNTDPTGGAKGQGSINAQAGLYDNGNRAMSATSVYTTPVLDCSTIPSAGYPYVFTFAHNAGVAPILAVGVLRPKSGVTSTNGGWKNSGGTTHEFIHSGVSYGYDKNTAYISLVKPIYIFNKSTGASEELDYNNWEAFGRVWI